MEALRRDTTSILTESASRKLSPASARDLVSYLKFIAEEFDRQSEIDASVNTLSDEDLLASAKAIIESRSKSAS